MFLHQYLWAPHGHPWHLSTSSVPLLEAAHFLHNFLHNSFPYKHLPTTPHPHPALHKLTWLLQEALLISSAFLHSKEGQLGSQQSDRLENESVLEVFTLKYPSSRLKIFFFPTSWCFCFCMAESLQRTRTHLNSGCRYRLYLIPCIALSMNLTLKPYTTSHGLLTMSISPYDSKH